MPGICEGRVVAITGAAGGIGRAHAHAFASEGARVVVNDLGTELDGSGASSGPAEQVAEEIRASGGTAVANGDDIADWDGARRLVEYAVDTYGRLDVLVNNAGILRDRMLFNMSIEEWDAVIRVHLRGTFATSRWAAAYWRKQDKAGAVNDARIINTTSVSGLFGNMGQANYGAAKAGIAAFTVIAAKELAPYGVTVNAVSPGAQTRMTREPPPSGAPGADAQRTGFDVRDPANVSPLVVWLGSTRSSHVTGRVFGARGGVISVAEGWRTGPFVDAGRTWRPGELDAVIPELVARAAPNADIWGNLPERAGEQS
jgi:NAD(P)-dependent dehydrogenase (short-subunit alcohol dehydrogenase family)